MQHPSLYSPEGLREARWLLTEFDELGASPQEIRRLNRSRVDSGRRSWKIKGTAGSHGSYPRPIHWTMTAADVVAGGPEGYYENVRKWARSVHKALEIQARAAGDAEDGSRKSPSASRFVIEERSRNTQKPAESPPVRFF